MSYFNYPPRGLYHLPRKNVLVFSCIDLRLTDNLLEFLHFDNLTNRYDHFALAGTSLMTQVDNPRLAKRFDQSELEKIPGHVHWKQLWNDHLQLAIDLHQIRDVYIIEHEDCGAYKSFLRDEANTDGEYACHTDFARALASEVHKITVDDKGKEVHLNVHCFFIDLRGNVKHFHSLHDKSLPPLTEHLPHH